MSTELTWRKSSFSSTNGSCVDVHDSTPGKILVRDSKDVTGPVLTFTVPEWDAFIKGVKNNEFEVEV